MTLRRAAIVAPIRTAVGKFGGALSTLTAGQLGATVSEMNITGNLLELFSRLIEVGNDPWPFSSTLCPTLVFDGVQFSGA